MKTTLLKPALIFMILAFFTDIKAQDIGSDDQMYATGKTDKASLPEELIRIGSIFRNEQTNSSKIKITSSSPLSLNVKFFKMNGDMVKEDTYNLSIGMNEVPIKEDGLQPEAYIIQFYTGEGSAIRRFIKQN